MRVEHLGDETEEPETAVLAAVHGDEPCGVRAIEALLADPPAVERPVKLVVANERALESGSRYVDEDLNRAFPGDPDADSHERRLAADLEREIEDCTVLALHSTQSHDEPFAVVSAQTDRTRSVCARLPVAAVVDVGERVEGRLFAVADAIEVECGLQGTDAAARNAEAVVRAFLAATDVLPDAPDRRSLPEPRSLSAPNRRSLPVFELTRPLPKEPGGSYEVFVENFEAVEAGEIWAAIDGQPVVAEEGFVPVLVSPEGYDEQFGYAAEKVGETGRTGETGS